jgi:hypothetical protein
MLDHFRESTTAPPEAKAQAEQAFASEDLLAAATTFATHTPAAEFATFLRHEFDPPDIVASAIHTLIARIGFRGIFTTNYDLVFEKQTPSPSPVLSYPSCLYDPAGFHKPGFLAKMHGCISRPYKQDLILTQESFDALSADTRYRTLLTGQFANHPVLTVGYSLRDPDFRSLLSDLRLAFGDNTPPIHALMFPSDFSSTELPAGVDPIVVDNPAELRRFFAEMLRMVHDLRPPNRPTLKKRRLATSSLRDAKRTARAFYERWRADSRSGVSVSRALGRVHVSLKGWRHLTRPITPPEEIAKRLAMLEWARELVERGTNVKFVRPIRGGGLYSLQGLFSSRFEDDVLVEVILKRRARRPKHEQWCFLSVFERRRSVDLIGSERAPVID